MQKHPHKNGTNPQFIIFYALLGPPGLMGPPGLPGNKSLPFPIKKRNSAVKSTVTTVKQFEE